MNVNLRTSSQNLHQSKANKVEIKSGKDPKTTELRQLLEKMCPTLDIPERNREGAAVLYKFIDCKTLSRKDSLELSEWLELEVGQNVDLLAAMQKKAPSFVPTLNLMSVQSPEEAASLFEQAATKGMTYGVSVTPQVSERIAEMLLDVMANPESPVTSFDEAIIWDPSPDNSELLRKCINNCTKLQYVSGSKHVLSLLERSIPEISLTGNLTAVSGSNHLLSLLERSIPEISLTGNFKDHKQFQDDLLRVLRLGGVEKVSFESDTESLLQCFVDAVAEANATLSPRSSVHKVELLTGDTVENCKEVVATLLSAKHVTDIALPDPSWMPDSNEMLKMYESGDCLESLQSVTFDMPDGLETEGLPDRLVSILQRNKQLALLATKM